MKRTERITAVAAAVSLAATGAAFAAPQQEAQDRNQDYISQQGQSQQERFDREMQEMENETRQTMQDMETETRQTMQDMEDESRQAMQDMEDESRQAMQGNKSGSKFLDSEVVSDNELDKFAKAVEQAGLTDALSGEDYTVFAPTDEAFEQLGSDKADELMDKQNVEKLREVLRSHIVAGKVDAEQARQIQSAKVLTGDTVELSMDNNELHVANAKVVKSDIQAGNLTIHAIDQILDPSASDSMDEEEAEE